MKIYTLLIAAVCLFGSCSTKKQIVYLNDNVYNASNVSYPAYTIQPYDILKIDIHSSNPEAIMPYTKVAGSNINPNMDLLRLGGYVVSDNYTIEFPTLGSVDVKDKTLSDLEGLIFEQLSNGGHLKQPIVSVRLLNARFSVLGEVRNPGTYSFVSERISIFQALGYAGDLTIDGERSDIRLIRETDGKRTIHKINLNDVNTLNDPRYYIHSNDVIIVKPNFNKVKSAGFIGNPQSISSIASLLLSITLLLIN